MAMRAIDQTTAPQTLLPAGAPSQSARIASTTTVNGLTSANSCSAGRHRLDRHERRRDERDREDQREADPVGRLRRGDHIPSRAKIHENAKPKSSSRPTPPRISSALALNEKPMISPVTSSTTIESGFVTTSASVRPASTDGAGGRQRAEAVDQALREVLGQAESGHEAAERDVLHDDPGDQEVDVVVARRHDRAAEDVDEQQHEHDRLDREADQQVGGAGEPHEVALGHHERVGDQLPHAATSSRSPFVLLGRDRLVAGEGEEDVVERGPPDAEVLDADAGVVEPAYRLHDRAGALLDRCAHRRPSMCGRLAGHRRERLGGRSASRAVGQVDLEPLAADAVLQLVGRAVGDDACRGR